MKPTRYEITFRGEAGDRTRAMFEDCDVSVERGDTVLRAEVPDQAALHGVLDRIASLGFELTEVRQVASDE
jgi:hypothetical protein